MSTQEVSTTPEVAPNTTAPETSVDKSKTSVKKTVVVPAKIAKKLETLEAKYNKALEDKKKLKDELSTLKSANSRIRRIPKTTPAETTA